MPRSATPDAKPWSRANKKRRDWTPDGEWADDIERVLLAACHPKQRQFVQDPAARVSAICSRGAGKTTAQLARFLIKMARIPRAKCVYIATTRGQAERIIWEALKDTCERIGIEADFAEVKLTCTLKRNGSTLELVGADNKAEIDKLRGRSFHEVAIDEGASYSTPLLEALLYRIIGPRLGNYGGCITMFGTPGHNLAGPFYESTRPGSTQHIPFGEPPIAGHGPWSSHRWTVEDGAPFVPALAALWEEALVEKERNKWSDDNPIWLREYQAQWAADDTSHVFRYRAHTKDGNPWNQWDPPRRASGLAVLPDGEWMYGYGIDPGSRDPCAINVFAFRPDDPERRIFHVFGFEKRDMYANDIAKLLVGEEAVRQVMRGEGLPDKPGGLYGETGWPAAIVADLAGLGEALIKELGSVYGIRIKAAVKADKFGNIEVVNGQLVDGKLFVLKGSQLEQQMMTLQWKPDEYGQPKEDKAAPNHSTDSCLYVVPELLKLFDGSPTARPRVAEVAYQPTEIDEIAQSSDEYSWLANEPVEWGL